MSLLIPKKDLRVKLPFGIIAKISGNHDPNNNDPYKFIDAIMQHLGVYMNPSDISYAHPNFVFHVKDPFTQLKIISAPLLAVEHFCLEMVPWSQEHEWSQIPWITEHSPRIIIDPLSILPITPPRKKSPAKGRLMDNFSLTIPYCYELKAPDYSYLVIAELRDLYKNRLQRFSECAILCDEIKNMLQEVCTLIEKHIPITCTCVEDTHQNASQHMDLGNPYFVSDLICHLLSTSNRMTDSYMSAPISGTKVVPLQLDSFTDGPMHSQVPLPKTYTERLKTIYISVIEKLFMSRPIIETSMTDDGRFHTFITIGNSTRRHLGEYKKSAIEQEAYAIYYSLKHITHIFGYNIVDLNYPTLQNLIQHIDTWNGQINAMHLHVAYAISEIHSVNESLIHVEQCQLGMVTTGRCRCIYKSTKKLLTIADDNLKKMTEKARTFMDLKDQYHSTWKNSESLVLHHCHWTGSHRPTNAEIAAAYQS